MQSNAISLLQEHCVHNSLPIPTYNFEDLTKPSTPAKFACHCKVGLVSSVSTASSKKDAKHSVAKAVLAKLGVTGQTFTVNPPQQHTSSSGQINPTVSNPVGMLNEYCSKNRYIYPTYFEAGVRNGEFVVKCRHQLLISEGLGSNKKNAKQLAAQNMLIMLNKVPEKSPSPPKTNEQNFNNTPDVVDTRAFAIPDDEVIRRYEEIIKKRELSHSVQEPLYQLTDPFKPNLKYDEEEATPPEEKVTNQEKPQQISRLDLQELERKFRALNLDFSMNVVSKKPSIISMKLLNSTLIEMDDDSDQCKAKLFKAALERFKK